MEIVYPPVVGAAQASFRLLGMHIDLRDADRVPATGGAVLASNHVSYLDFIFCGLASWRGRRRLTRFMAKEAVFRHPVSGPLMRGMHHIPVDRTAGGASFTEALGALRAGELVGIFPEATISRSFTVKAVKNGAVRLAAEADVPILPVALWGGQRMFTKGHPRDFSRGRTISIAVGEPLHPRADERPGRLTAELRTAMQGLLDDVQRDHPETADPGLDAWWLPAHLGGTAPTPQRAAELDVAERKARARRTAG